MSEPNELEASFNSLVTAIAAQAALAIEDTKPTSSSITSQTTSSTTSSISANLALAKFNIDLLLMLLDKTQGNLNDQEKELLLTLIRDLQAKYLLSNPK